MHWYSTFCSSNLSCLHCLEWLWLIICNQRHSLTGGIGNVEGLLKTLLILSHCIDELLQKYPHTVLDSRDAETPHLKISLAYLLEQYPSNILTGYQRKGPVLLLRASDLIWMITYAEALQHHLPPLLGCPGQPPCRSSSFWSVVRFTISDHYGRK